MWFDISKFSFLFIVGQQFFPTLDKSVKEFNMSISYADWKHYKVSENAETSEYFSFDKII